MQVPFSIYEHSHTWVTVLALQDKELESVRKYFNENTINSEYDGSRIAVISKINSIDSDRSFVTLI